MTAVQLTMNVGGRGQLSGCLALDVFLAMLMMRCPHRFTAHRCCSMLSEGKSEGNNIGKQDVYKSPG